MSINFRQPKYTLPLIALPFLCLFFYVWHSSSGKNKHPVKQQAGLNSAVGDVSPEVKKRSLEDKLAAYQDRYKDADGASAVTPIPSEVSANPQTNTMRQKRQLDSIDSVMKRRFSKPSLTRVSPDQQYAVALNSLSQHQRHAEVAAGSVTNEPAHDPMELFKKQMAYMDSVRKVSDPNYQKQLQEEKLKAASKKIDEKTLSVTKASQTPDAFNTIMPLKEQQFITAVIDENVTGYAGSRIRLRLLEPINAGNVLIPKDTYLYALISGFSGQRVSLTIKTILYNGQLLPVKLAVYDQDGLDGLYVPNSQFRDFTKDASTNVMQGVDIQSASTSYLMSAAGKLFESTSSAIASAIRKDKARIKYNSYVYLIDTKNLNQ
ncbi:MAG: conjugative transposon protein TraM [Mucilaginibacter sp.]